MRILLIGNIANNAYHDAKLLRRAGVDCDVVCADYYHVMGCPEWEDADFSQAVLDAFRPDWNGLDLHGFARPGWFAQGPVDLCLDYLLARRRGESGRAARLWLRLGLLNRTQRARSPTDRAWMLLRRARIFLWRVQRLLLSPTRVGEKADEWRSQAGRGGAARRLGGVAGRVAVGCSRLASWLVRRLAQGPAARAATRDFDARVQQLAARFAREFPHRADRLEAAELWAYRYHWERWRALFAHYDFVQAFAADVAIPLIADVEYVGFEHGTLRDLPQAPTLQGRLIALGYRCAAHTFVTNLDCIDNARRITEGRYTFINHPYDETAQPSPGAVAGLRETLESELDASLLVFHPTRHDWVAGRGYADKANDALFEAVRRLREQGVRVGLVCCAWGNNVAESRQWFDSHGLAAHVAWREPMGMVEFRRYAAACEVVADQFKLGAFGGVTFKSLAVGGVLCTFLDEAQAAGIFAEPPPVLNCRSPEEIVAQLAAIAGAPERLAGLRARSRAWIERYHRGADLAATQLRVFRALLDSRAGAARS